MKTLDIKPLTANRAWNGRKRRTPEYKWYIKNLTRILPKLSVPLEGKLQVHYIFGVSSKLSDYDNPIKQFQDVCAEFYGFNDRRIYRGIIEKIDVPKGKEFIKFKIEKWQKTL